MAHGATMASVTAQGEISTGLRARQEQMGRTVSKESFQNARFDKADDSLVHGQANGTQLPPLREEDEGLPDPSLIAEALKHILESESFRTSPRGKQFLSFVVQYRLENHPDSVKERIIGAALFNRPMDYATGDDSVVRAQAREVRRRLERYYSTHTQENRLRIELPIGSYTPEFRLDAAQKGEPRETAGLTHLAVPPSIEVVPASEIEGVFFPSRKRKWLLLSGALGTLICVGILLSLHYRSSVKAPKTPLEQFWAPALISSRPLLICLPKPIFYRPSVELYKRSARTPREFDREVDRMNNAPHLQPSEKLTWGEMVQYYDYGVGEGDVQAAFKISSFLAHQGKDTEIRIGAGFSTADLRNSPAAVIGAFSHPWGVEMTSGLRFAFVDDEKGIRIQEQGGSGRSWQSKHGPVGEDYGLVTRLTDSNTGQFVVLVAGVEGSGSDAAADLIVNPNGFAKALQEAPKDWAQKNVQILVTTTVKDSVAGPAKVIAVYVW